MRRAREGPERAGRGRGPPRLPLVINASGAPSWPRPCWCQCRPAALARRPRGGWWRATARWRRRNVAFSNMPRMNAQPDRAQHATQAVRACRSIGVAAHMWRHCCDRAGEEEAQRGLIVREPSISSCSEAARSTSCTIVAITMTCAFADVDGCRLLMKTRLRCSCDREWHGTRWAGKRAQRRRSAGPPRAAAAVAAAVTLWPVVIARRELSAARQTSANS